MRAKNRPVALDGHATSNFALLSPATGKLPEKMLLLSADSGIGPLMDMLRDLYQQHYEGDVVFLHVCRRPEDLAFASELEAIAADYAELGLVVYYSDMAPPFTPQALQLAVPDLGQRSTWMCAPGALMDDVQRLWKEHNFASPLYGQRVAETSSASELSPST